MLCQFSFKNFSSYRDETTFDLQAAALPEFSDSLIQREKCSDLLPVAAVYGPNGGGKSNLLMALTCLISTVVKPIHELGKNRIPIILQQTVTSVPFLFDEVSSGEPTEFRVFFRTNGNEYLYYLALFKDEVVSESLSRKTIGGKKPARIFDREGSEITLGYSISKSGLNKNVNPKMPYLSFLAINYSIPVIEEVQEWFESCVIRNYANSVAEREIMLSDDEVFRSNIIQLMNDMGIDIAGFRFDKENSEFYLQRTVGDKLYELPFVSESDGTKKLFAALPVMLLALQEGRLVVIDELDAKLHPKLLRHVIALFKNMDINKHGAQLLFTSHDVTTMKNTVFRRDEIWFAAENEERASEIYSLYEIRREDNERVNNTAAYDKQYLEGRYGADPYLQNMLSGGGWK